MTCRAWSSQASKAKFRFVYWVLALYSKSHCWMLVDPVNGMEPGFHNVLVLVIAMLYYTLHPAKPRESTCIQVTTCSRVFVIRPHDDQHYWLARPVNSETTSHKTNKRNLQGHSSRFEPSQFFSKMLDAFAQMCCKPTECLLRLLQRRFPRTCKIMLLTAHFKTNVILRY